MFMPSDAVQVRVTGSVGTIVLNRPDHGNALTRAMIRQLHDAFDDLYGERRVRAIVLAGSGEAFCRGLDLAEMQATRDLPEAESQWGVDASELSDLLIRMLEITKPTIAAAHGAIQGAGAALVAAADIAVAADDAVLQLPETR
ncbi:MAG: enoyl-CoA hydratase/isomerase family protein [Planctomycetales bacterium]|nr:enoyl-CoA hydratase/isomerase family protein [Planctomycetales bacterium]